MTNTPATGEATLMPCPSCGQVHLHGAVHDLMGSPKVCLADYRRLLEQVRRTPPAPKAGVEQFIVKHYTSDERPIIKGNGFDGLEVGETREDAQEFVDWINARLAGGEES